MSCHPPANSEAPQPQPLSVPPYELPCKGPMKWQRRGGGRAELPPFPLKPVWCGSVGTSPD
eukprot:14035701-Alexandrium_andersonii.AAC.1